ncbi:reverse transcriptase domain-containing protein [Tanacetum coccineum]
MRTRSQTRNRNRQQQAPPAVVEPFNLEEPFDNPPLVPMADNRTMAELLQAPTEGYEDAIVIPEINANFELKHGLINLVQNKQFFGHDKEDPHAHIRYFNKITSTMRFPDVPSTSIKLMLFPFSLEGGNFLDKMPHECLKIIESKSKVRNSRNKAVVAKVSSNSSTNGFLPNVAALTTEVSELKNMMKTMLIDKQKAQAPVPVKAVEQSCVTCGGAHSYRNCPATDGNVYRDNIQEYVSQAAAANFNQGNTNSRPSMVANQIRPPGFPMIQNNQSRFNQNQGNIFNQNWGTNVNQNRGNNFYQGQVYQPPTSQPPVYQAHPYQASAPQMQGVSKTDFENYVKANDAILRNMQNQGQGLQNQMTNLTEMLSKFVNSNTASTSSSGSLPSNTVTNPKEDLKGITTRSGVVYQGPTIPTTSSPKVVERKTEVTKDTFFPTNNGITEDVQPPVVPVENQNPVSEPVVAPVSASMPNPKPSIPYPSRRNDEKRRENANEQKEKFYEILKDMSFEISFMDALTLMPKFASTLKALIGNKEKLSEMARTPLNEHCSAVILNKLPEKLGDPGRFLIPCKFPGMDECLALADLGASINLMPFSVWKKLNLPNLTPTCMTLELADRSISRPIGIAKDVNVKVGVFQFPADFVVVDFEPDPRVPLILGRCFLKTSRALIDVYEGELTLRVDNEAITYNLDQTSRYSVNYNDMTANNESKLWNSLLVSSILREVFWNFPMSSAKKCYPLLEFDPNSLNSSSGSSLLSGIVEFLFLKKRCFSAARRTTNQRIQHQRRVNPKIHDVIKKEVEKLLDVGLIYPISDSPWYGGHSSSCYRATTLKRNGQVEVSNRGLKQILERTVGENRASWSDRLDDALWAFRTAYKTPIDCTPYKLVYGKSCHLPIELEHRAYWALKQANFDLKAAGNHQKLQLNELNELRDQAYENSLIYKERTKKLHDSKIKNRIFNVGDQVLLFNSRLKIFSGKLKTRWSGPFTITEVFPYGTAKLSHTDGSNFKVNFHRLKHYFGGDTPTMVVPDLQTFPKDE